MTSPASDRIIVALDVPSLEQAEALVRVLRPWIHRFKVGPELSTAAGPDAVRMVHRRGGSVFLDLKWHDIPSTVAAAVRSAARLGVAMMNVHIAAGADALRASAVAAESAAVEGGGHPLLLGVTVLTSQRADVEHVAAAAREARACGLHGVVASAREAAAIKAACGADFLVVSPGIRPASSPPDDQRRTATAAEAVRLGADYLVVGRPVTQAPDPAAAVRALLSEMEAAAENTNEGGDSPAVVRLTP